MFGAMTSTMMDVPLTIDLIVDRAERWMGEAEVVSRRVGGIGVQPTPGRWSAAPAKGQDP